MLRLGRIEAVITLSAGLLLFMLEARPGCPLNASTPKPAAAGAQAYLDVVETASNETFETYLREHIWKRAGMASASLDIPERIMPHRARSYRIDHAVLMNYYYNDLRYKFASGGMIASVEDLAKLGAALNHDLLLRPETRATMLSPQIEGLQEFREGAAPQAIDFEEECKSINQHCQGAMLWRVRRDPEGRRVAYQCGSVKGFNACLVDFLDEDLVAAIATNSFECCGWVKADALAALFRPHGRREGPQRFPSDATPSVGQTTLLRAATEKRERGPV